MKKLFATVSATALLALGAAAPAALAQVEQDGLVNVNIGDITIEDVNVLVAATIVANVCPNVNVSDVYLLAQQIDSGDVEQYAACTIGRRAGAQDITITQND